MKTPTLWYATLSALSAICLLVVLAPLFFLLVSSTPASLWQTLASPEVLNSLGLTFFCGLLATVFGVILGVPLAYLLARFDFPGKTFLQGVIDIPVVIPHPVAGIALLLAFSVFGSQWGPVSHWTGIVFAMFFVSVSLLVNALTEGFRSIPEKMEWTSRSLGVSAPGTFLRVSLPLVRHHLMAGSIMMWARSISEFGSIVILVYNPKVASVLIYDRFTSFGLAASLPVAVILVAISLTVFLLMRAIQLRKPIAAN